MGKGVLENLFFHSKQPNRSWIFFNLKFQKNHKNWNWSWANVHLGDLPHIPGQKVGLSCIIYLKLESYI